MILFISNYPDKEGEKDGMMQRVLAVDGHFSARDRVYLGIRFFGNLRQRKEETSDRVTVYRVNFFLHFLTIMRLGSAARGIYVHSIHNSFRALPLYLFRNVITDLHGVFPEELRYCGKRAGSLLYGTVEWVAVRCSRALVVVTDAMAEYYRTKYGRFKAVMHTIPIFDDFPIGRSGETETAQPVTAIYAGGMQKWQNVDLMLQSLSRARQGVSCVILTPETEAFTRKLAGYGMINAVTLRSVAKSEVYNQYQRADLGFILRDDSIVNRVACPTKLVEYLACGVIPVVLQPLIGDFAARGYSVLSLERFDSGDLPSREEMEAMRRNNYRIIGEMRDAAAQAMKRMIAGFTEGCADDAAT
jgi:glycosyltransferase involved in cell wall biosynthesis